ncbi:MAG: hypothetical protein CXR31_08840 [Geobacter sp.]|nr:MAG: hypothetical protein CXR31_08840 [Geobacter sp.]
MSSTALAEILGVEDQQQLPRTIVLNGLDYSAIERLAELYDLKISEFCNLLPVSQKTLERHKEKRLGIDLADHLVLLGGVYERALEVMETREYALNWLKTPNYAFSYTRPLDLLRTFAGGADVLDELGRIQHGIFV